MIRGEVMGSNQLPAPAFGRAIGVMSGTSGDGVDAVLLELGSLHVPHRPRILSRSSVSFPPALQAELCRPDSLSLRRLSELHYLLPTYSIAAIKQLPDYASARVCGVHGQTVWHQTGPEAAIRCTLQIGCSALVAQEIGCQTVGDLRAADVALGGTGAPIAPLPHWFFWGETADPAVVLNLGGMSNLTAVGCSKEAVIAFDLGPGMAPSNAFAVHASAGRLTCDLDGQLSDGGKPLPRMIEALLRHPFVRRQPPKSCGREEFSADFAQALWTEHAAGAAQADIATTLLHLPLALLRQQLENHGPLRDHARTVVLTGGGALNPNLRRAAAQILPKSTIQVDDSGVFAPANHEPAAMALIAARTLEGLPSSLPQVTGARRAAVLGHLTLGA
jgi:anhydro-N-acetylmuramic acid kinase